MNEYNSPKPAVISPGGKNGNQRSISNRGFVVRRIAKISEVFNRGRLKHSVPVGDVNAYRYFKFCISGVMS